MAGTERWPRVLIAGAIIGVVEAVAAVAFATLVFIGRIDYFLAGGIALYLGAAALTLGASAWWAGRRGVVGSLQATGAAALSLMAATTSIKARGSPYEGFLAVVAATFVVTVLCGVVFLVLGAKRRGDMIRYVPYPVVGGFVAGLGWLLLRGGIHLAFDESPFFTDIADLFEGDVVRMWLPALAFGVILLIAVRVVKKPLVIPIAIGVGLVGFAVAAVAMGASVEDVRRGGWLIGPFRTDGVWQPWSLRAVAGADWVGVAESWGQILVAVFVTVVVLLFNIGGAEQLLDRDLDTDEELRDAGRLNVISGVLGGIPGYHSLSLTSLAARMDVDARRAGLVAAAVPLAVLAFGGTLVGLVPRALVGGILVFIGLGFLVEWVWDKRKVLPRIEYLVVLAIVAVVIVRGFLPGIIVGLVLAVVLFAISYGRVDLVHEVAFGAVYRSNVDRPPAERAALRALADQVQILRLRGYVFFGSTNGVLERIRARAGSPPRFLVIDLRRVTGVDASAVAAFGTAERLAAAYGSTIVLTGATDVVRARLGRGGILGTHAPVWVEPDLDRGLERCEEALLAAEQPPAGGAAAEGMPPGVADALERMPLDEGAVLLRQDDPAGDLFVLAEGRLAVETVTPEGTRVRVRSLRPGAVVGEIAFYTGTARTADVVAQTPCVVLRCSRERIAEMEAADPPTAAALHRWLARTLAGRLDDTMHTFDALMD